MNEEYPSNSHASRANPREKRVPLEEKKFQPVVTGNVKRRKKTLGFRLRDTFLNSETGVFRYLYREVLLPSALSMVADLFNQGFEKATNGYLRSPLRPGVMYRGGPMQRTHVSYNQPTSVVRNPAVNPMVRRPLSQPQSNAIDEIILDTKFEAETIAEKLYETLEEYGTVTVAVLNDLLHQSSTTTDHKYGWYELKGLDIHRVREGYALVLPDPVDLK